MARKQPRLGYTITTPRCCTLTHPTHELQTTALEGIIERHAPHHLYVGVARCRRCSAVLIVLDRASGGVETRWQVSP